MAANFQTLATDFPVQTQKKSRLGYRLPFFVTALALLLPALCAHFTIAMYAGIVHRQCESCRLLRMPHGC